MFEFGSRRRSFDRQNNNEQNSTGYSEKTVLPTDFGSPENSNYQNGYVQPTAPQNSDQSGGYMQSAPINGGYTQPTPQPQNYAYGQNAAPVATAQVGELPMVFASHTHSDVYIYEYSDRLEYYLKTATNMLLFSTVKKQ